MDDLLSAGYRVLRFDNRGVVLTDKPEGPYTTRLLADDTEALVDALGIDDFHMVGVSMGGMVAQEYALVHGGDLRSLILACTYAAPDPFCPRMFSMWADLAPEMGAPFIMRDVALWAFTAPFFEDREEELMEFEAESASLLMTTEAYLAQLAATRTHDAPGRLGGVPVPTLVLAGEDDILIPVPLSRRLHEAVPSSEWATTGGGHACLWEHPEPFNRAVLKFLERQRA